MTADKILLIAISTVSAILSLTALVVTYRQKWHQDRLAARKTLSDLLSAMVDTTIEMAKLRERESTEAVMQLRRALNSRRRYLAQHAELMTAEVGDLTTDVDFMMLAMAHDSAGDLAKADANWIKAVEASPAPLVRCYNFRGYARYLLTTGKFEAAREAFRSALKSAAADDDRNRRERSDTLILWALAERDQGFAEEATRLRGQAISEAKRIGGSASREDMLAYIAGHLDDENSDRELTSTEKGEAS